MRSDLRSRSLCRRRRSALRNAGRYKRFAKLPAIEALEPRRLLATEVVLDSEDTTQVDVTGEWIPSAGVFGFHGANYLHDGGPGQGQKQITFHPNLPQDGHYDVMLRWTAAANRASNASVNIDHRDGTSQKTVNQQIHNGAWISVGEFAFTAGSAGSVSLSNQGADGYVIADAVRLVLLESGQGPELDIFHQFNNVLDGGIVDFGTTSPNSPVDVQLTARNAGNQPLDISPLNPGGLPIGFSLVSNIGTTSLAPGSSADFTLRLDAASLGSFGGQISISSNDGDENPYRLQLSGSVADVPAVDELVLDSESTSGITRSGQWFASSGSPGFVGDSYLHDGNSERGQKQVRYTPNFATSGRYEVFARWTSFANRSSRTQITIHHNGGPTDRFVDQRTGGGIWNSLGQYDFDPGTQYHVALSNSGADGYVIADAIRFLRVGDVVTPPENNELIVDTEDLTGVSLAGDWPASTGAPGFLGANYRHDGNSGKGQKSATFWPDIPADGSYEVFLRWTSAPNRASNAPVRVDHADGEFNTRVDQRTGGGRWNSLGEFPFRAGRQDSIVLSNFLGADGYVIADAVRLVPADGATPPASGPEIQVLDGGSDVSDGGTLQFGSAQVGSPVDKVVTVRNVGDEDLQLTQLNSGNLPIGFALVANLGTTTLTPGAATNFTLRMTASQTGSFSGPTNFASGDSDENPFDLFLTGTVSDTPESTEIIIDSEDANGVTLGGSWLASSGAEGFHGNSYWHDGNIGKGQKSVTLTPSLAAGVYDVSLRWTSDANRASNTPVTIVHADGEELQRINQRTGGGQWNLLGQYLFSGSGDRVTIANVGTDGFVIADAVRFVRAGDPPPPAAEIEVSDGSGELLDGGTADFGATTPGNPVDLTLTVHNRGNAALTLTPVDSNSLPDGFSLVSNIATTSLPAGGSTNFTVRLAAVATGSFNGSIALGNSDADENPFDLTLQGTVAMTPVSHDVIVDSEDASGVTIAGDWIASDGSVGFHGSNYLHDGNSGKGQKSVTFTPTLPSTGSYEVSLRWTSSSNRAGNAEVTIHHRDGVGDITVDQRAQGSQWVSLGQFNFDAGSSGNLVLSNTATDGYVIADAARFVRKSGIVLSPQPFVVDSEDTSQVEVVGQWIASQGSAGFHGANYLHDQNTGQGEKQVQFTPKIAVPGRYELFMRWTSASNRASNVPVEIEHRGGKTAVTVDQRVQGGQWVSLGEFDFRPGIGSVAISNVGTNGFVIVDALRFVPRSGIAELGSDTTVATPGHLVKLTSSRAFSGSSEFEVVLTDEQGNSVAIQPVRHTEDSLEFAVPPWFDGGTQTNVTGNVNVAVVETAADQSATVFLAEPTLNIAQLPQLSVPPGEVTLEVIDQLRGLLALAIQKWQVVGAASDHLVDTSPITDALRDQLEPLLSLRRAIDDLATGQTDEVSLLDGVKVQRSDLETLDDFLSAFLLGQAPVVSGASGEGVGQDGSVSGVVAAAFVEFLDPNLDGDGAELFERLKDVASGVTATAALLSFAGVGGLSVLTGPWVPALLILGPAGAYLSAVAVADLPAEARCEKLQTPFKAVADALADLAFGKAVKKVTPLLVEKMPLPKQAQDLLVKEIEDLTGYYSNMLSLLEPDNPNSLLSQACGHAATINSNIAANSVIVSPTFAQRTSEAGASVNVNFGLNSQPLGDVSISIASSDVSEGVVESINGRRPAANVITFTPTDWFFPRTVTIKGVDDDVDDGEVDYRLNAADASSSNPNDPFHGAPVFDVTISNLDNDTAGVTVIEPANNQTSESGGAVSYSLVLNTRPTANVTLSVSSSDTSEGTASPSSFVFTPNDWNNPRSVTVTGVEDSILDLDQSYRTTHAASSSDAKYNGISIDDVTLVNRDNDRPPAGVTVELIDTTTSENRGQGQFRVKLDSQPLANVTILIVSSDTSEGRVISDNLTFTPQNSDQFQTVVIEGVDDSTFDGDVSYDIILGGTVSEDPEYSGLDVPDVTFLNVDNESPPPAADPAGIWVGPAVQDHGNGNVYAGTMTLSLSPLIGLPGNFTGQLILNLDQIIACGFGSCNPLFGAVDVTATKQSSSELTFSLVGMFGFGQGTIIGNNYRGSFYQIVGGARIDTSFSDSGLTKISLLQAAELPPADPSPSANATPDSVAGVLEAAVAYWNMTGSATDAGDVRVKIVDLPGATLGGAAGDTIYVDKDAAGFGWFVDATPLTHEEFLGDGDSLLQASRSGTAAGRMDLLTAVMHELGHLIGHHDLDPLVHGGELMAGVLQTGTRQLPWSDAVDSLLATPQPF